MSKRKGLPVVLTVAGSDSGGGAGVQADLKVFLALEVHGACAVTCLTAQNPSRVARIQATPPSMVSAQIAVVLEGLPPSAIKTGMLCNAGIVKAASVALSRSAAPLVVDPVMISTSGRRLLEKSALKSLEIFIIRRAALVTPNLSEAEVLLNRRIRSPEGLRQAARDLHARWGCAVLAKGGHLPGMREAIDFFYDGQQELVFSAPLLHGARTHGTGCAYSAAITAFLAHDCNLPEAIRRAKRYISQAIASSRAIGRAQVLDFAQSGG